MGELDDEIQTQPAHQQYTTSLYEESRHRQHELVSDFLSAAGEGAGQ